MAYVSSILRLQVRIEGNVIKENVYTKGRIKREMTEHGSVI